MQWQYKAMRFFTEAEKYVSTKMSRVISAPYEINAIQGVRLWKIITISCDYRIISITTLK
jgi:hypothetical protein